MPDQLGGRHWQLRAEETRVLAETMKNEEARRTMFRIAADYEKLAVLATAIEHGQVPQDR